MIDQGKGSRHEGFINHEATQYREAPLLGENDTRALDTIDTTRLQATGDLCGRAPGLG